MKNLKHKIVEISLDHPKFIVVFFAVMTIVLSLFISGIKNQIDTDPENMLAKDEPTRVFNDEMKKELSLNDMVVIGVVNDKDVNGVFNIKTLSNIFELTKFAESLTWPDKNNPSNFEGVIDVDVMAPSVVDNIEQGSQPGEIKFEWLMPKPPTTKDEALAVRDKAMRLPFFKGTLVSEDGKAIAIYLPLTRKSLSYRVSQAIKNKVFLLMLYFFRKLSLIISPMIIAMMSVLSTMGLLIGSYNEFYDPDIYHAYCCAGFNSYTFRIL